MPTHGCFACGALLDDTCGKDAKGRWLCGPCLNKRQAIDANVALQAHTKNDLEEVAWWRRFFEVVLSALSGW